MADVNDTKYIGHQLVARYGEVWIKNFPKIMLHISTFINDRQNILSTKNYGKRLIYTQADANRFYEAAGVDEKEVIQVIKECKNINHSINDQTNPLYNVLFILASFYDANADVLKKYLKPGSTLIPGDFVRFYLGLRIYSICQRQIFKNFEPKEEIVEYTLEHINNKFHINKYNNLYDYINNFVETNGKETDCLKIDFKDPIDVHIYQWCSKLIKRLKEMLKNLFRATQENYNKKNKIVVEDIQATNEEGKKFFTTNTNVSNTIEILSNKVLMNFIQETSIRDNLVTVACKKSSNISKVKVKILLNDIKTSKDNVLMTRIIKDILSYWIISLNRDSNSIHSEDFIKKSAIAYSISNTNDIFVIDLKETLLEIITKYYSQYTATESKTTINSFKQAVFLYMVFYISSTC